MAVEHSRFGFRVYTPIWRGLVLLVMALSGVFGMSGSALAQEDDLGFLTSVLRNASVEQSTRVAAATRLLRLGGDASETVLADSLRSDNVGEIGAVIEALVDDGVPRPRIVEALLAVLSAGHESLGSPVGTTLARLSQPPIEQIATIALSSGDGAASARIAAIGALGEMSSRSSVDALMRLLEDAPSATESAAITSGLRKITRIDLGENAERWISWWAAVSGMPLEQAIGAATADSERLIDEQQAEIERLLAHEKALGERLQAALGRWFLVVSEVERAEQLRAMLGEELTFVRLFAAQQVQRMLRNGVAPEDATVEAVSNLIDDKDGTLRLIGAQLLAAMRVDGLPNRLAEAVAREQDATVASGLLEQIALRPGPEAFEPVVARLTDPVAGPAAARALARLVDAAMVPPNWADSARVAIRILHRDNVTAATAALLVLAGEPADLEAAIADLDNESAAVRRAAANAFVTRAMFAPVLARASDDAIRPAAIKALVAQGPTRDVLAALLAMTPIEAGREAWLAAVRSLAVRFALEERLAIDDVLAAQTSVPQALRADLLKAALAAGDEALTPALRLSMLDRYAKLLAADNRWQAVAEVLGRSPLVAGQPIEALLFQARMRLSDFEGAAAVESRPEVWLDFLAGSVDAAPAQAVTVAQEIRTRFESLLTDEQRERLESLQNRLTLANGTPRETPGI